MNLGKICEQYTSSWTILTADQNAVASQDDIAYVLRVFAEILDICERMQMPVSRRNMENVIDEIKRHGTTTGMTRQKYLEWYSCFQAEVADQVYMLVLPHRVPFWNLPAEDIEGPEIHKFIGSLAAFPGAVYDAREAGNCFAYERFTACVYHLMRVAEYALVSIACSVGVEQDRIATGWDGCIGGIQGWINKVESAKPKPMADWKEQTKQYSDLCAWLTSIKKGWRNPVSHIPRIYLEDNAKAMFSATMMLVECCSQIGLRQVAMPESLPVDAPV